MPQNTKFKRRYVRDNNCWPEDFKRWLDKFERAIDALEDAEILYSSNYKIKAGTQQFYDENWEAIEDIDYFTSFENFVYDAIFTETIEAYPELGERYISLVERIQDNHWEWLKTEYYLDIDFDRLINHTYYIMSGEIDEDIESGRFNGPDSNPPKYMNERGREYRKKFKKDSRTVGRRIKDSDTYVFKLSKRLNDFDEYVLRCYKNGKYYEPATGYVPLEEWRFRTRREAIADAWEEAKGELDVIAKQLGLTVRKMSETFIIAE